jgi:hypothetical protein
MLALAYISAPPERREFAGKRETANRYGTLPSTGAKRSLLSGLSGLSASRAAASATRGDRPEKG